MASHKEQFKEHIRRAREKAQKGKRLTQYDLAFLALDKQSPDAEPPRFVRTIKELSIALNLPVEEIREYEELPNAPQRLRKGSYDVKKWEDFIATADDPEDLKPWEQQPGEPAIWYARFRLYRDLPQGERTLLKTYQNYKHAQQRANPGKSVGKIQTHSAPNEWSFHAGLWKWIERAAAWDLHINRSADKIIEEERIEERRQQIEANREVRILSRKALRTKRLSQWSVYDSLSGIAQSNKDNRVLIPGLTPETPGKPVDPDEIPKGRRGLIILPPLEEREQ